MPGFLEDVVAGLSAPQKTLPSKYFYDAAGSALFEEITRLPEYYPTRVETALLQEIAPELAAAIPSGAALVEFGNGSSAKTRILLRAAGHLAVYAPLDISPTALSEAAEAISAEFPDLAVNPIVGDFTAPFQLPSSAVSRPCVGFFPGSTIGNFGPEEAVRFLADARRSMGTRARFIVGYDLVKEPAILEAAYDDAQGVTAAFNLNLLARINAELGADFDLERFHHGAVWNASESRVEMHLVSDRAQTVHLAGATFPFREEETIRSETSYKYTEEGFEALAVAAGWRVERRWVSPPPPFGVALLAAG